MEDRVILVDEQDNVLGEMPKLEAHEKGVLHRAFSVFIFNSKGEMMLQRRALSKYHTPGLWSNTCCSHPRLGESVIEAGERRLQEEMGFSVALQSKFSFIYKVNFDNGLIEHELDHVLFGQYEGKPKINKVEVEEWSWKNMDEIDQEMVTNSKGYTFWFRYLLSKYKSSFISSPSGGLEGKARHL
jgi:isopentenyl-diphosphate delta-isomerase